MNDTTFGGLITITNKGTGFQACLTENPNRWEAGSTANEAVGKLVADASVFASLATSIRNMSNSKVQAHRILQSLVNAGANCLHTGGNSVDDLVGSVLELTRLHSLNINVHRTGHGADEAYIFYDLDRIKLVTISERSYDKVHALNLQGYWAIATNGTESVYVAKLEAVKA